MPRERSFKYIREKVLDLTQPEIAKELGISVSAVQGYERKGDGFIPKGSLALALEWLITQRAWHDVIMLPDGSAHVGNESEARGLGLKLVATVDRVRLWKEQYPGQLPLVESRPVVPQSNQGEI